jgi:phage host-nuclease inhibitor protein Gam
MSKKFKNVFKTKEEMETAIVRVGALQREKANLETVYGDKISALKKELSERVAPLDEEIQSLSEGIKFFLDVNREKYIPEDKKSLDMPVGTVGYRKKPASVVTPKKSKSNPDPIMAIIEMNELTTWLESVRVRLAKVFIRQKLELDKEAILANPTLAFEKTNIKVEVGGERFYIKPDGVDLEVEI